MSELEDLMKRVEQLEAELELIRMSRKAEQFFFLLDLKKAIDAMLDERVPFAEKYLRAQEALLNKKRAAPDAATSVTAGTQ